MVSMWHGRDGAKPFNICKMCWNTHSIHWGLQWSDYLWEHCGWDLKNNPNLCYPMIWKELKLVRFCLAIMIRPKPILNSMHTTWLSTSPDQHCVKACWYDLPVGANLFQLNIDAVNDGTIPICKFDFVESRDVVEWNQCVLSMIA